MRATFRPHAGVDSYAQALRLIEATEVVGAIPGGAEKDTAYGDQCFSAHPQLETSDDER